MLKIEQSHAGKDRIDGEVTKMSDFFWSISKDNVNVFVQVIHQTRKLKRTGKKLCDKRLKSWDIFWFFRLEDLFIDSKQIVKTSKKLGSGGAGTVWLGKYLGMRALKIVNDKRNFLTYLQIVFFGGGGGVGGVKILIVIFPTRSIVADWMITFYSLPQVFTNVRCHCIIERSCS